MHAEPSKQRFLPPLTGIRGLTILWMVIYHLHTILTTLLPTLAGFVAVTVGVKFRMDLLFILSGFLISYVYIGNRDKLTRGVYGNFLRSRLIRLYPGYLATTLFILSVKGVTSATSSPGFRIGSLLMLGGFLITCVLLAKRVEEVLRVCVDLVRSFRPRFAPITVAISSMTLGLVMVTAHFPAVSGGHYRWTTILVWLAMLQAWPCVPLAVRGFGAVWFLSALWFAYLFIFPIAWRLVHRMRSRWGMLLWVFIPVVVWLPVSQVAALNELRMVTRAACGFLCGSALFALYANRSAFIAMAQRFLDLIVLLFLAVSILIPVAQSQGIRRDMNFLLVLAVPFLLAGSTGGVSFTARFLASRPLLWLGEISYSLFLSHEIAIELVDLALPSERYASSPLLVRILIVAAYLAFILLTALGLYHFVEAPWVASLKSFSAKRPLGTGATLPPKALRGNHYQDGRILPGTNPARTPVD